jgi:hypothetical protein
MLEKKFGLNFCVSFCEKHMLNFFNSLHRTQVITCFCFYNYRKISDLYPLVTTFSQLFSPVFNYLKDRNFSIKIFIITFVL